MTPVKGMSFYPREKPPRAFWMIPVIIGLAGLVMVSQYNFLLFHTLAELFSIAVAWAVFFLVWNTRRIIDNDAFVFIGLAYFFIGFVDILHTLAYKGMGVFDAQWGANLPTQLWIVARYMESAALVMFPVLLGKKIRLVPVSALWLGVTVLSLALIFYRPVFPACYIEGIGLTPFKIISEYVICLLLSFAVLLLYRRRDMMAPAVFRLMALSMITTIFAELAFTFYVDVYDFSNLAGHLLKIISFYLIYLALVRSGLTQPYSVLFKSLKDSEEKYQNIFNNAQVGLFCTRIPDGRPVEINDRFAALCGYPGKEDCLEDFDRSENHILRRVHNDMLPELKTSDIIKNREIRIRKKDGSPIWVSISGCLNHEKGHIEGALVDISERRRQEAAQAAQIRLIHMASDLGVKDLLRKFLDEAEALTESEIGFFHFLDEDQQMLSLQTWSTHTSETLCRTAVDTLHYPVSRAGVWVDCIRERKPVIHNDYHALPYKKPLPEGHAPVIRELVVPVIRSGKIVAILGVGNKPVFYDNEDVKMVQTLADSAWEVIVRKRAEEDLQKACEQMEHKVRQRTRDLEAAAYEFESLFDSSQVGMMVLKQSRFLVKGNQRLADILGYVSPGEMQGLSMRVFHLDDTHYQEFGERYYNRLSQGKILQVEYPLRRKDGSSVWCSLSGKALDPDYPTDLNKGVLWIIDDTSDRKKSEQDLKDTLRELERSNSELAQFAYVASHDLQEPLRAIVGFLQLLESRYKDHLDDKGRHYIERAVNAGHRMQTLITDLLTLSRVNTRQTPFEPTDFNEAVTAALDRLGGRIREKNAMVRCDKLPVLTADKNQIHALFRNLISNALKYNDSVSPVIRIGATETADEYCFRVKDNGIGIDPKFHERIFIVFQRLHGQQEYSGTGVGLTLCRKIVERHGGRIWVESENKNGSTFFFTLPKERMDT